MKRITTLLLTALLSTTSVLAAPRLKPGDRIVTLGDSITQAGGYQALMQKVLARFYPDLGIEIVNAGIGGHKAPDMAARLQKDVIDRKPTIVTVSCGVNDVWHGFYNPPRGVDLETYTHLMTQMVQQLKANTSASIYLLTPTVIHENLRGPENLKLEAYCEAIREIARREIITRFQGTDLTLHFTTTQYSHQLPTLWQQVDEGEWEVVQPAEDLRISPTPLPAGTHVVRLVVKGFREWENRWDAPLVGSVVFRGVTLGNGAQLLPAPERPAKLVEFLGDSITEGVLVLNTGPRETWIHEGWPQFSDGRRSWAYQSAMLAGVEPRTVGFGRLGLSINANGGVPPALHSFPFVYAGAPIDKTRLPDAVVINMGTNDGQRVSGQVFGPLYRAYLETIRKTYPLAQILCLRPFNGAHASAIEGAVRELRDPKIHYVDTTGWIDAEKHTTDTVHLNLEGNRVAAEKVAAMLKTVL